MYDGPVIDVDVHHSFKKPNVVLDYLPAEWKELITGSNISTKPAQKNNALPFGTVRFEAYPPDGSAPGSSFEMFRDQILDPLRVERAILSYNVGIEVYHENPYLGAALASASNDWSVSTWLNGLDDRLYGAVLVGTQLPDEAAREIARVGDHPRMVEVLLVDGGLGPPFGHPAYHPIYAAAAERNLPVAVHFGSNYLSALPAGSAGGTPPGGMEFYTIANQAGMHHLVSLITHGVFEKWPSLRFVLLETGFAWLPWLMAELDAQYPVMKRETPWVKRLPSDYLRSNVKVATQPFELSDEPAGLLALLDSIDGIEEMLVFATDYPHWDTDETDFVSRHLPSGWHRKVFYENALGVYRWPAGAQHASGVLSGSTGH